MLKDLFEKRNQDFKPLVENVAYQAIKNTCIKHTADEYLTKRPLIEKNLFDAITVALRKDAHAILDGVQLRRVDFPASYVDRKLMTSVQELKNDEEVSKRNAALIRQMTTTETTYIRNDARQVEQLATVEATLIRMRAENTAIVTVQKARTEGLKDTYTGLNITRQDHKLSLDYLSKLSAGGNDVTTYVDFPKILAKV